MFAEWGRICGRFAECGKAGIGVNCATRILQISPCYGIIQEFFETIYRTTCFLSMKMLIYNTIGYGILLILLVGGCTEQFTGSLFKEQYPHQRYWSHLEKAGLDDATLYRQWAEAAERSLEAPVQVTVPYQESGYLPATHPDAFGYVFAARQGEQLVIDLRVRSADTLQRVFLDLFSYSADTASAHGHLASADTNASSLRWNVRKDGNYVLRVQPELLADLSFELRITAEASLAGPVDSSARQHIGSVFGDPRDGGARRHEGIDIFADHYTPVVAAAEGTVTRVGDNRLGGRVLWLRPGGQPIGDRINLYYAHLDTQLVVSGQAVQVGDTLGLMGNTGNARTTPPHLHFGVYGSGGAVDPLPYVQPKKSTPPRVRSDPEWIGDTLRIAVRNRAFAPRYTPVVLLAAAEDGFRILLPDGSRNTVGRRDLERLTPLRNTRIDRPVMLYASPDSNAARVARLTAGETARVVAEFGNFMLIDLPHRGWIGR